MGADWLSAGWKWMVARGALAIVFGVMAMAWPIETAIVFALLWGIWAVADGIGSLVQAFSPESTGRVWLAVMGGLAIVAGLLAIVRPGLAAGALTWILGIWLIVRGLFEVVGAFSSTVAQRRWLLVLSGGLSIVLGFLFTANPGNAAVALAFWLGIVAVAWGAVFVVTGLMVRREGPAAAVPPAAPA
ncbi:MAG TPA: HdeD family acid-resistance protein [Pedococcus sp.]